MHTRLARAASALALSSFLIGAGSAAAFAEPTTDADAGIPDDALRTCLAEQIPDGIVTPESIAALTTIDCSGRGIIDLTGLEQATGATDIDLSDNLVEDVLPSALQSLTAQLDVSSNRIAGVFGFDPERVNATNQDVTIVSAEATYDDTEFTSTAMVIPFEDDGGYHNLLTDVPGKWDHLGFRLFPISGPDETVASYDFADPTGRFTGVLNFPLVRFNVNITQLTTGDVLSNGTARSAVRITLTDKDGAGVPDVGIGWSEKGFGLAVVAQGEDGYYTDARGINVIETTSTLPGAKRLDLYLGNSTFPHTFNFVAPPFTEADESEIGAPTTTTPSAVAAPVSNRGGHLANTGASNWTPLALGAGFLALAGAGLTVLRVRRSRAGVSAE
ncbi:LPXTG cell wall anchor domain-containing protein [Mycetocola saprophilus]|uniref:LPXTG cell wall anchor domain-containing protein n=1 Tax=Mycetocola saprophilus TaxID=76636 RepID=UPI003BF1C60C